MAGGQVMDDADWLVEVLKLAGDLDSATLERVAGVLRLVPSPSTTVIREASAAGGTPGARTALREALQPWKTHGGSTQGAVVSAALTALVHVRESARAETRSELVWTGPLPQGATERRTDQALLEVIRAAQKRLLIVSFAAYRVPELHAGLAEAVDRGVTLEFLFESAAESGGRVRGEPASYLPPDLAKRSTVLVWSRDRRTSRMQAGKKQLGVLHAKCALADEELLLVSSANLTPDALTLNMELGVLVRGGALPTEARRLFDGLVEGGTVARVGATGGSEPVRRTSHGFEKRMRARTP